MNTSTLRPTNHTCLQCGTPTCAARAGDPNADDKSDDGEGSGGEDERSRLDRTQRDFRPPQSSCRLAVFRLFYEPNDKRALGEDGLPISGDEYDALKRELEEELLGHEEAPVLWRARAGPEGAVLMLVALNMLLMTQNSYGIPKWRADAFDLVRTRTYQRTRTRAPMLHCLEAEPPIGL